MNLSYVNREAKTLGATVEDTKNYGVHECRVEAPKGMVWAGLGTHEIVDVAYQPWKPDYEDVLKIMKHGVETCPDGDMCEWCNDY